MEVGQGPNVGCSAKGKKNKKLVRGGDTHKIHRQQGDLIRLLLFFQIKESRLKDKKS
jgi:hypothetical protein